MRLRAYIEQIDFPLLQKWTQDERIHSLWCANQFLYPLQEDNFKEVLQKNAAEWEDCAYTVTEDDGKPIGFFVYNTNYVKNHGFLKFIILDNTLRGLGYGTKMIQFICRFAFEMTAVSSVVLNVFDANTAAVKCYQKAGFSEQSRENNVFSFQKESWGKCRMTKER